jgi:hypothetical protein
MIHMTHPSPSTMAPPGSEGNHPSSAPHTAIRRNPVAEQPPPDSRRVLRTAAGAGTLTVRLPHTYRAVGALRRQRPSCGSERGVLAAASVADMRSFRTCAVDTTTSASIPSPAAGSKRASPNSPLPSEQRLHSEESACSFLTQQRQATLPLRHDHRTGQSRRGPGRRVRLRRAHDRAAAGVRQADAQGRQQGPGDGGPRR